MPKAFVVTPDRHSHSLNVVGEKVTVLASGAQTGGYEIFLQVGPEGSGPPPHNHPWDKSFYVTSVPAKATISLSPMPNATPACGKVSSALSQGIYDTSNGFCRFTISFDNG